jgi:hypothetical protein
MDILALILVYGFLFAWAWKHGAFDFTMEE